MRALVGGRQQLPPLNQPPFSEKFTFQKAFGNHSKQYKKDLCFASTTPISNTDLISTSHIIHQVLCLDLDIFDMHLRVTIES